jgi:hypothetical protein
MYCRSRPQYRSDLGWILGVAFLGTLTRSARPAQGFTYVRCCSAPPASSPHGLAAPGRIVSRRPHLRAVAFGLRLLPTCSAEDLHLQSRVHAWHTKGSPSATRSRGLGPLTPPPQPSSGHPCHYGELWRDRR